MLELNKKYTSSSSSCKAAANKEANCAKQASFGDAAAAANRPAANQANEAVSLRVATRAFLGHVRRLPLASAGTAQQRFVRDAAATFSIEPLT